MFNREISTQVYMTAARFRDLDRSMTNIDAYAPEVIRCLRGRPFDHFIMIDENQFRFADLEGVFWMLRCVRNSAEWFPRMRAAMVNNKIPKIRAEYIYTVHRDHVRVIDRDRRGHPSVTNDIDEVILELAYAEINLRARSLIYQDSTGFWDIVETRRGNKGCKGREVFKQFTILRANTAEEAIARIRADALVGA